MGFESNRRQRRERTPDPSETPAQALAAALPDLPQGSRHALLTCLREHAGGRLPPPHLVAFVRSVARLSPALAHLRPAPARPAELLSAEEMRVGGGSPPLAALAPPALVPNRIPPDLHARSPARPRAAYAVGFVSSLCEDSSPCCAVDLHIS